MERGSEEMTERYCWGGLWHRPSTFLIWAAFLATFFITPVVSQTFDVVIIEEPHHLIAYDAFQQSLASSQLAVLQPFVPMKILKAHDVLGDGLTSCMKVDVDGNVFFLLSDNSGRLVGWNKLGTIKTYERRIFLQDTISILVSNKITFQSSTNGSQSPLAAGDRCVRYFENAGSVYVKRLRKDPAFGWIRAPGAEEGSWWKIVHTASVRSEFSSALRERINGRIRQVNQTLAQIYIVLNRESGKRLTTPQWYVDPHAESLRFVLLPDSAIIIYPKSVEVLKTSLQTYLLGTSYNAFIVGNKIDIKPR
jgi:hypothetical protein